MTEQELRKKGWTKQNTIDEPRLSELVDLYESLGLEVRLESVVLEEVNGECQQCLKGNADHYTTIYTRQKEQWATGN